MVATANRAIGHSTVAQYVWPALPWKRFGNGVGRMCVGLVARRTARHGRCSVATWRLEFPHANSPPEAFPPTPRSIFDDQSRSESGTNRAVGAADHRGGF